MFPGAQGIPRDSTAAFQEMVQGHRVAPSTAAGALRHMAGVLALLHQLTHLESQAWWESIAGWWLSHPSENMTGMRQYFLYLKYNQ